MKPPGSNLDLEHSNGACWIRLTRGENGTGTVASVDLGDAVPTSKDLSELPSVEDTIDVAREDAEANVPTAHHANTEQANIEIDVMQNEIGSASLPRRCDSDANRELGRLAGESPPTYAGHMCRERRKECMFECFVRC